MKGDGEARVKTFLRPGEAAVTRAARSGKVLLDGGARGAIMVPAELVRRMLEAGALVEEGGALRLAAAKPAGGAGPHPGTRDVEREQVADPGGGVVEVLVNHAESPLAALMRRKTREGAPFLSQPEFRAGERLRADYSRGGLMPRLGMNWSSPVASGRRGTGGGVAELTDAALGARVRVERALAAVGPELSGVLIDVCCFLKGLEQVEAERGWPVRSAKIVLKAALSALARHYEPGGGRGPAAGSILRWGAEDYRPNKL